MLYQVVEVLIVVVPILISVALMTIIERKGLGSMQRRVGPNTVGFYGLLQPFADALKLLLKESLEPQQTRLVLFLVSPMLSLVFGLLGWAVVPIGLGGVIEEVNLGVLYSLAISSLGVYGVLLAGWSANSKYALLGSIRSAAQMISYELLFSTVVLCAMMLSGSFKYSEIMEAQEGTWYVLPLFPLFLVYFLSVLAETNRTPFDLVEAESELVSGFFTEHSSMPFVFFFLAEYSSIVLISCQSAMIFLGGYNLFGLTNGLVLGLKTCAVCLLFVWFRATLPRLRYDQLMEVCWKDLLPVVMLMLIMVPSILVPFVS